MSAQKHPAWCDAHERFEDGSSDWHQSSREIAGPFEIVLTTGTASGEVGLDLFPASRASTDTLSLLDAERLAWTLLAMVERARV